jgi:D-alanine-D-alanine ligase
MGDRILVLWNQPEEDVYERLREEGPTPLAWDPEQVTPDVGTVAEEMDALVAGLRANGFEVAIENVHDDLERLLGAIRTHRPDVVFNLVEFFQDESIQETYIAGLYELLGVHYTGNRPLALATCQNKYRTKILLEAEGLPTPDYLLIKQLPVPRDHPLVFPLIVKPALEDASGGIEPESVCIDQETLEDRVGWVLTEFDMPALVEEYIEGREIHVAVLGNDPPICLPLFEMEFEDAIDIERGWQPRIISFRAKWDPRSEEFYTMDSVCPAQGLDPEVEDDIRRIALRAYEAMGCRDYARVDLRVDDDGDIWILEVNPNPDLIEGAGFVQCAEASGRSYAQVLGEITRMALERKRRHEARKPHTGLPTDLLLREWTLRKHGKGGGKSGP